MLATPRFHHLHLNSVDPAAAIGFYTRVFASTSAGSWEGFPALQSPNDVLVLFTKVDAPPPSEPQSAIWHFGWHVGDARATLEAYRGRAEIKLLPLYTSDDGGSVLISSDTWPNPPGRIGRTKAEMAEAIAAGVAPPRRGGFAYLEGPDAALVEYAGDYDQERFNHVHLYQEDPLAALRWYQEHLGAAPRGSFGPTGTGEPAPTQRTWPALEPGGMLRSPRAGVEFGDVSMMWYPNQGDRPLVSPLGQFQDHIGLSVGDLDAWVDKLKGEGVTILDGPYKLGDTRAVMIEGPSREAIELVEVK